MAEYKLPPGMKLQLPVAKPTTATSTPAAVQVATQSPTPPPTQSPVPPPTSQLVIPQAVKLVTGQQLSPAQQLQQTAAELKAALDANNPGFPILLKQIHDRLKEDPALVTLIAPEDMGIVVQGLIKMKGIVLVEKPTKTSAATKAKLGQLGLGDL